MDVRYYFEPVEFSDYYVSEAVNWRYSMGAVIEKGTLAFSGENMHKLNVAIIGVPFDSRKDTNTSEAPNKIRKELYRLSKFESKINIADFGNLKPATSIKGNFQALRDIVDYFNELKINTIIIGGSQDLTVGICKVFQRDPFFTLSTIDSKLDIKKGKETFNSSNYLTRIFKDQPQIFQFSLIGFQSHFVSSEYFSKTKGISHHIRLGRLRDDIKLCEPVFRNTDVVSLDIGAIKYAEAPGNNHSSPNGLRSEEACQLAKYAGISNRLKVFGLFEVDTTNDENKITVKLSAQIIWYFLEGYLNRIPENPGIDENNTMYRVEVKDVDKPLVFYKNTITNQWWMQIEMLNKKLKFFGCSKKEYEQAANNEIPELWIKYIQKLDELLK